MVISTHAFYLAISTLITLVLPLSTLVYALVKRKYRKVWFLGAAVFIISQLLFRLPLLQFVLPSFSWYTQLTIFPVMYGLFLSSTAGVVEEGGRWLGMRKFLAKEEEGTLLHGIFFGLGHGGIESILLVGINHLVLLFNPTLQQQYLGSVDSQLILIAGLERVLAISFHVGASLIVFYGVNGRRVLGNGPWRGFSMVILAMVLHTALNSVAVILPIFVKIQPLALEVVIGVFALATLGLGIRMWQSNATKTHRIGE